MIKQENLKDFEVRLLLEVAWHHMGSDVRRALTETVPVLYNKACGCDVVDVQHGSQKITINGRRNA